MALTGVKEVAEGFLGPVGSPLVWRIFDVNGPTSYTTGGEFLTASDLKVSKILFVMATNIAGSSGTMFDFDYSPQKIRFLASVGAHSHTENTAGAYVQNATTANQSGLYAERGAGQNFSSVISRVFVIGVAP